MKKLIFLFVLLFSALVSYSQQGAEYTFKTLVGPTADTITYDNNYDGWALTVTDESTDSCKVYGAGTGLWTIAPGKSVNIGYPGFPIVYLRISVASGCTAQVAYVRRVRRR